MQHLDDGLLNALVDGEVPSAELVPIQAHLDGCAECRTRLDQARAMAGESNALIELIEVPAAGPSGQSGQPPVRRLGRRRPGHWIRPLALAASLALAVALGYAGGTRQDLDPGLVPSREVDTVFLTGPQSSAEPTPATPAPPAASPPAQGEQERGQPPGQSPREEPQSKSLRDSVAVAEKPGRRELGSVSARLDEVVVTAATEARKDVAERDQPARDTKQKLAGAGPVPDTMSRLRKSNELAAKALARAPEANRLEEMTVTAIQATPISFIDAAALLGGRIRLIDGMVPKRLEAIGTAVRVVYPLERGELVLEQRREADSVAVVVIAPTLSADSIAKLRARIR